MACVGCGVHLGSRGRKLVLSAKGRFMAPVPGAVRASTLGEASMLLFPDPGAGRLSMRLAEAHALVHVGV